MQLTAYVHMTCPKSRELLEILQQKGMRERCRVVDVAYEPFVAYGHDILSVPALLGDGAVWAAGNIDAEWLGKLLDLYQTELPDGDNLFKQYIGAVIDNVATAAYVYLYEEHEGVLANPSFVLSASGLNRVVVADNQEILTALRQTLDQRFTSFLSEKGYLFHKVLAVNFLRELYWIHGDAVSRERIDKEYNVSSFAHWLYVRPTLGRIGVRHELDSAKLFQKATPVWEYLRDNLEDLWPLVQKSA
jgi:predicted thioredoxin/glutaredoxin